MSLISFINKNTYEVVDELEDYIYCDYDLRYIIAELNKKGYKTLFSCSGHLDVGLLYWTHREPIEELEDFLKQAEEDSSLHLIKKNDKYFYHKDEKTHTCTYITFDKVYDFNNIPKDFVVETVDNKTNIYKKISFYKDIKNTERKSDKEISSELNQNYEDLKEWVSKLKTIE